MSYVRQMFESHPFAPAADHTHAVECITACYACAEACNAGADAGLAEENVGDQVVCIRKNLDCADLCLATARIVSRLTATDRELVGAQLRACELCAGECQRHSAHLPHCASCAEACQRRAQAGTELLRE